jgi:hypothetical protein
MKSRTFLLLILILITFLFPSGQLNAQAVVAVNDTIDLYPGIPKTVNLLANDTIPLGDSIRLSGGGSTGNLITFTFIIKGIVTYLVKPLWGFNGNLSGTYRVTDVTLGEMSVASILFRIHDHSYDSLDINNVKAAITAYGNEFWLPANPAGPLFRIPKDSQTGTLFNFSLWAGGKGSDSVLYLAAERYRQRNGSLPGLMPDFYAGPVMDSVNYSTTQDTAWSRVWKIRRSEVEYHKTHWSNSGYVMPENILTWPGDGNPAYGQAADLAPYHDGNGNHHYDPGSGDYPVIPGDEAIFAIYNDDRDAHKETLGNKMKLEIHLMAYAFDMPEDSAFKNTIFFSYRIFNRSSRTYYNTYLGMFADFDIGQPLDDYLGCDVERSSYFGYNGYYSDGNGMSNTYGLHPPAQSVTILGGPLMDPAGQDRPRLDNTGHQLCNESVNGTGFGDSIANNERYGLTNFLAIYNQNATYMADPTEANQYYHTMQSYWLDTTRLFYGGMGHAGAGGYGPDCRFMFPGESDSLNWGTGCQLPNGPADWTSRSGGFSPGDVRGVGGMGPFTFRPGEVRQVDIAFVFARDYTGADSLNPSVDKLRQMIDIVRNSYTTNILPNGKPFFGTNDQRGNPSLTMKIYPNPANNVIHIAFSRIVSGNVSIRMINVGGTEVFSSNISPTGNKVQLDVRGLPPGIYIVNVQAKDFTATGKAIIIR